MSLLLRSENHYSIQYNFSSRLRIVFSAIQQISVFNQWIFQSWLRLNLLSFRESEFLIDFLVLDHAVNLNQGIISVIIKSRYSLHWHTVWISKSFGLQVRLDSLSSTESISEPMNRLSHEKEPLLSESVNRLGYNESFRSWVRLCISNRTLVSSAWQCLFSDL